ncbi:MAG: hypothetical protein RQ757_03105 [Pseudomonadales bacterium]|nr:hypothetical protein [Pseudomonadales bacterium]
MLPFAKMLQSKLSFTAFFLHLMLSISIFFGLFSILLLLWYPSPYFSASGGWQGLRLVVAVDLVLGPVLTLIVYKPEKSRKELFFDLSLIVLIQLSALVWGINAVYQQRPVASVFWQGRFYTVPAEALSSQGFDLAGLDLFGEDRPVYVYAQPPVNESEYEQMLMELNETRVPPHEQPHRYMPLAASFEKIKEYGSIDIVEIVNSNADMAVELEKFLQQTNSAVTDYYYQALVSRYRNIILIFDQDDKLVGTLDAPLKYGEF